MLCALTTPSPDERTDLGEIEPLIVLIKTMGPETSSPFAVLNGAQSETITTQAKRRTRTPQLY